MLSHQVPPSNNLSFFLFKNLKTKEVLLLSVFQLNSLHNSRSFVFVSQLIKKNLPGVFADSLSLHFSDLIWMGKLTKKINGVVQKIDNFYEIKYTEGGKDLFCDVVKTM